LKGNSFPEGLCFSMDKVTRDTPIDHPSGKLPPFTNPEAVRGIAQAKPHEASRSLN
jgi:hypothetical protein